MRRNVLSWLTEQAPQARHALILTHNVNFLFVQNMLVPRLRAAGNPRLTIFADATCARASWQEERRLLDGLGVRYRVVPVDLGPWRRFHPKALLLANREGAALAIGSGNLTHGGMAANQEAWVFGVSDGEGAGLIAAFRDYLRALVAGLPLPDALTDAADALFEPELPWVAALPAPLGLAGSPAVRPLLDQIADHVTGSVHAVSVIAPYYDDDGAALAAVATRFAVPVTCWMQAGRAGLSRTAGDRLPSNVTLKSIRTGGEHESFVHAKLLAFHRDDDVVLAVGSANCSRAALLADQSWGNAELMAIDVVTPSAWDALFDELEPSDDRPDLPEAPPSDDWPTPPSADLQVLAARQDRDVLQVAFKMGASITDLRVVAHEGSWQIEPAAASSGHARLAVPVRLRVLRLAGTTNAGLLTESEEVWVDDEESLSVPATFSRIARKMSEADGQDPTHDYTGLLELFRDYIRDPEARRRRVNRRDISGDGPPKPYDPSAVFSESFGRSGVSMPRGGAGGSEPSSILAIIEALFSLRPDPTPRPPPPLPEKQGKPASEDEVVAPARPPPKSADERARARLSRTLKAVQDALCEPAFVQSRSPELLGADLAMAGLLLVKGLADGLLHVEAFRGITRALWAALFFGERGAGDGSVMARLQRLEPEAQHGFVATLASAQLSGALALWGYTEWAADDSDAAWFRFSAAELAERFHWLFAGATPEAVVDELETMTASLRLKSNEQEAALRSWVDVVRAGEALHALRQGLGSMSAETLRVAMKASEVGPRDLVWAAQRFAFPLGHFRRDAGVKAAVRFLGGAATSKFLASHLIPVREAVTCNLVELPPGAQAEVLRLIDSAGMTRAPTTT